MVFKGQTSIISVYSSEAVSPFAFSPESHEGRHTTHGAHRARDQPGFDITPAGQRGPARSCPAPAAPARRGAQDRGMRPFQPRPPRLPLRPEATVGPRGAGGGAGPAPRTRRASLPSAMRRGRAGPALSPRRPLPPGRALEGGLRSAPGDSGWALPGRPGRGLPERAGPGAGERRGRRPGAVCVRAWPALTVRPLQGVLGPLEVHRHDGGGGSSSRGGGGSELQPGGTRGRKGRERQGKGRERGPRAP